MEVGWGWGWEVNVGLEMLRYLVGMQCCGTGAVIFLENRE
jgi:hypothetical protein